MRIALKVAYDGTKFFGFQRQKSVKTVEGELIRALQKLDIIKGPRENNFKGASRTDRGVSAFGNVVSFDTENLKLVQPRILNHHLKDIWVLGIAGVGEDFHPRYSAEGKIYRYYMVDEGFDLNAMKRCSKLFIGTHNFSNFARLEQFKNPVRTLDDIKISKKGKLVVLEFSGESFLWEMIRRIVTALKMCGISCLSEGEIEDMLNLKVDRKLPPAPAENLVLWEIKYPSLRFEIDESSVEKAKREFFERFSRAFLRAALFEEWLNAL
ncbi:tRNA pseudouridine(38-40) synthase TruA [Thermococci archaeon]|nr:MAG: tRNA pseudouridine(38-40) synthase TruA [Thermococci archaeon]